MSVPCCESDRGQAFSAVFIKIPRPNFAPGRGI